MSLKARRWLAALSGVLLWLSFPNPFALHFEAWTGWVAWSALVPLCASVWGAPKAQAFRHGLLAGFLFFALSLYWLIHVRPMGLAAYPAWWGLALWCGLFVAAWAWVAAWASERGAGLPVIALAAAWSLLELLREHLFTGFPWVNLGSSQALNGALLPLAANTGQVGLHFAVALGNLCLFALIFEQKLLLGAARSTTALLAFGLLAFGVHHQRPFDQSAPPVKVGIIQGGIDLDQAWTKAYRERVMNTYLLLSQAAVDEGAQVLLWPESSFPGFFNEGALESEQVKAFAKKRHVHMLIGSTLVAENGFFNSALWVDPAGNTLSQGKRHLVPFGEYVPFRKAVPILDAAMARMGVSEILADRRGPLFDLAGLKTRPLVCYESVFPDEVRQGEAPDLLGVITVDTWYGNSAGPVFHAQQCALRAVENGAWVARAAATGISLFADPQGQLIAPIALDQAGYQVLAVGRGHRTFYREQGEWMAVLLLFLLAALWGPHLFTRR